MWDNVGRTLGYVVAAAALLGLSSVAGGCRQDAGRPSPAVADGADRSPKPVDEKRAPASSGKQSAPTPSITADKSRYPAAKRIVAFGDVHGDLEATTTALEVGGAIDSKGKWIGGDLVVVQTGDQLDRGDSERAILDLLVRLEGEAKAAGGALHVLNGNHEIMNALGDLRYVTPGGLTDFASVEGLNLDDPQLSRAAAVQRPRLAAFLPGGPYAKVLAARNTVVVVGDTVFAHGGVIPEDAKRIDEINDSVRRWLAGTHERPDDVVSMIMAPESVVWTRRYSASNRDDVCADLAESLRILGARRMVVGHTVQKTGITSACDGAVWRIDVGLATHYGGKTEILEIVGDEVKVKRPA